MTVHKISRLLSVLLLAALGARVAGMVPLASGQVILLRQTRSFSITTSPLVQTVRR
jgi:hypothetical protein